MSRLKVLPEKKVHYVEMYKRGRGSEMTLAKAAGVSLASFQQWLRNYEVYGAEAFTKGYQHYTLELKTNAVRDYLNGEGSQDAICKKYGIRSKSKLQNWITVYNSHGELRSSHRRRSAIVTKGRKTTFEERLSIVADCIAGGLDYNATAEKFHVSYQQVYTWVKKQEKKGVDGLRDGRGRKKPEDEMSELERLRHENRIQKAQLLQKQMEIDFLKKLKELERE